MSAKVKEDDASSIVDSPPVPPRDDLVQTAAQFLQSPKVAKTSMHLKTAFLKKKGLSDAEIELAVKQAEEIINRRQESISLQLPQSVIQKPYEFPHQWALQPRWMKCRDVLNAVILFGGVAYGLYWCYKKYVVPYLFGRRSRKTIDVRLNELEKIVIDCIAELTANMNKVREDIERVTERKGEGVNRQIEELKTEITSLKKLLLNRKQFPTASVSGGPLSIPVWQRAASPPEEKEAEEEGNGSGTNGSDSSLEMIKE